VLDAQLDPAGRVGLDEVHELPGNDARRNLFKQRPQRRPRHDTLEQPPHRAARAYINACDFQRNVMIDGNGLQINIVDAYNLTSVDVYDLLVEQVAL